MPGVCKFSDRWLTVEQYSTWLAAVASDRTKARCKVCLTNFDISNMGETALRSHAKGEKHQKRLSQLSDSKTNPSIAVFYSASQTTTSAAIAATGSTGEMTDSSAGAVRSIERASDIATLTGSQLSVARFVNRNVLTSAEILWALKITTGHMSYHSCCDINVLFTRMFPDSEIARQFTCSENKCSYLCRFGLAPYFQDLFIDDIKGSDAFVILFDESLNFTTQRKQMDLHVCLWDVNSRIVHTRYFHGPWNC